jgi:hypothetical protein
LLQGRAQLRPVPVLQGRVLLRVLLQVQVQVQRRAQGPRQVLLQAQAQALAGPQLLHCYCRLPESVR